MASADAINYLSHDTWCHQDRILADRRSGGLKWGPKGARKDPWPRPAARAKSFISTWMRSTHLSNSVTIRSCAGSPSRSVDRANEVLLRPQVTKHASSACIPRCRRSQPSENAPIRCLQGDLSADPGDLRRIHADHRGIVTRRGVSRCD